MHVAFYEASNLTTPPNSIPNKVENFSYAFYKCENLNTVPILGNNITNIQCSFGYTNIEIFDVTLPENITNMCRTFEYCSNLKEFRSKISDSVTDMRGTFQYCSNLKEFISVIPDSVTDMQATFSGCESLVTGPSKIPNSVKSMFQTFRTCSKLEGTMEINADIDESIAFEYECRQYTGYQQCFLLSCQDGAGLKITGTCLKLNELKDNNPNITIY